MACADTEVKGLRGQKQGLELVYAGQLHVDKAYVQDVVLHQVTGSDRAEFLKFQPYVGMLFVEGVQKLWEEDGAEHGRDPDADHGLGGAGGRIACLQVLAVRQDGRDFVVEGLSLLCQGQAAAAVGEEGNGEFLFQIPDGDGDGGLGHKEGPGRLGDAVVAGSGAEISELGECHGSLLNMNFLQAAGRRAGLSRPFLMVFLFLS